MADEGQNPAHEEPEDKNTNHQGDAKEPSPEKAHNQTKGNTG